MALGKIEIIPSTADTNTSGPGSSSRSSDAVYTGLSLPTGPASDTGLTSKSSKKSSRSTKRKYKRSELVEDYYDRLQEAEGDKPGPYTQGAEVTNYQNKLKNLEANKPAAFQSRYETQIQDILSGILNEKDFSYTGKDMLSDDLYKLYRDQYTREGNLAMRDAAGNAASLTGGYGSTYSQAAGQQAYDAYLGRLNDRAMDFYDRAYQRYQDNQANRYRQLSTVQGLDDTDYGRYRDTVGDYYTDLNYLNNRYQQEYANDYGRYRDTVGDYFSNLSYLSGRYDSEYAKDYGEYQGMVAQDQFDANMEYQREQDAAEAERWAQEWALKQRDADLDYNIKTLQYQKALEGAAGGSGGSGGGGGGRGGSRRRSSGGRSTGTSNKSTNAPYNGDITVDDAKRIITQEAALHGKSSANDLAQSLLNSKSILTTNTTRKDISTALHDHVSSLPEKTPVEKWAPMSSIGLKVRKKL